MNADRLKELRDWCERCRANYSMTGEGRIERKFEDILALIDSALQPASTGEIGERILSEVRDAYSTGYRAGQSAAVQYEQESLYAHSEARAIAYVDAREDRLRALSNPGEQQQLVEALVYSLGRLVEEVESTTAIDTDEEMQACLKDAHAALSAHKASDVPTAGDAVSEEHIANEWADEATNGLQWLRNVKDGTSNVDEAIAHMERGVARVQALRKRPTAGDAALREDAKLRIAAGCAAGYLRCEARNDKVSESRALTLNDYAQLLERFAGETK
jgi:hypothetical protein